MRFIQTIWCKNQGMVSRSWRRGRQISGSWSGCYYFSGSFRPYRQSSWCWLISANCCSQQRLWNSYINYTLENIHLLLGVKQGSSVVLVNFVVVVVLGLFLICLCLFLGMITPKILKNIHDLFSKKKYYWQFFELVFDLWFTCMSIWLLVLVYGFVFCLVFGYRYIYILVYLLFLVGIMNFIQRINCEKHMGAWQNSRCLSLSWLTRSLFSESWSQIRIWGCIASYSWFSGYRKGYQ